MLTYSFCLKKFLLLFIHSSKLHFHMVQPANPWLCYRSVAFFVHIYCRISKEKYKLISLPDDYTGSAFVRPNMWLHLNILCIPLIVILFYMYTFTRHSVCLGLYMYVYICKIGTLTYATMQPVYYNRCRHSRYLFGSDDTTAVCWSWLCENYSADRSHA